METLLPTRIFLTRGAGRHPEKLVSFEMALRDAGISPYNLVRVSSIFPPGARMIERKEGLPRLRAGQILFVVMSENATDEANRLISASIGAALPSDPSLYGYLAEHSGYGEDEAAAGIYTEKIAAEMLATKLGKKVTGKATRRGGERLYRVSPRLTLRVTSISQTAEGRSGMWTTAIAAAVLI